MLGERCVSHIVFKGIKVCKMRLVWWTKIASLLLGNTTRSLRKSLTVSLCNGYVMVESWSNISLIFLSLLIYHSQVLSVWKVTQFIFATNRAASIEIEIIYLRSSSFTQLVYKIKTIKYVIRCNILVTDKKRWKDFRDSIQNWFSFVSLTYWCSKCLASF